MSKENQTNEPTKRMKTEFLMALALMLALQLTMVTSSTAWAHKSGSKTATKDGKKPWAARKDCSGVYGKKTKAKTTHVSISDLLASPGKYQGKLLHVKGSIQSACKFKGCWMMLSDGKQKMRIRFKDYGFFVPVNSKGYNAVVVGKAKVKILSVKMLRHYAMDAGKPEVAKKITKPKKIVAFMADWVELSKGAKHTAKPKKR